MDYICDYAHLEPDIYPDVKSTPTIMEIWELSFAMRCIGFNHQFMKYIDQYELPVSL